MTAGPKGPVRPETGDQAAEPPEWVPEPEDAGIPGDAWDLLAPHLAPARRERMLAVAAQRTRHLRLIIQDIHNPHNVSACLRSAEAFGIQDVDVVTLRESFRPSTAARGVASWLTVRRWRSIDECARALKAAGYLLVAGVPRPDARPLGELPVARRLACIFGNEHDGIHPDWMRHLDHPFTIPMVGMVESLNISVCAAVTLHTLAQKARAVVPPATYHLSDLERQALLGRWVCRQFQSWETMLARLRPG